MICSREEESLIPAHSLVSHQAIFNGYGESVTNVKISCYVGRRETNYVFFGVGGLAVGVEKFAE